MHKNPKRRNRKITVIVVYDQAVRSAHNKTNQGSIHLRLNKLMQRYDQKIQANLISIQKSEIIYLKTLGLTVPNKIKQ